MNPPNRYFRSLFSRPFSRQVLYLGSSIYLMKMHRYPMKDLPSLWGPFWFVGRYSSRQSDTIWILRLTDRLRAISGITAVYAV